MSWLRGIRLMLLAGLAVANAGCIAAAAGAAGAGAATYVYFKGRTCQEYGSTFKETYYTVIAALEDLKYPLQSQKNDGVSGTFTSSTEDSTAIWVDISTQPSPLNREAGLTRVCVRVGAFGDTVVSERILAKIGERLMPRGLAPRQPDTAQQHSGTGAIQPVGWNRPGETGPPPELPSEPGGGKTK